MDIAKKANVCKATVSLALADSPKISAKRRKQIKDLAWKMGYRPNVLARGLAGGRTHTIGVIWSLAGPHPSLEMTQHIAIGVQRTGYFAHVTDSRKDWSLVEEALGGYAERRADGIVLEWHAAWDNKVDLKKLKDFPAVVVVTQDPKDLPFDQVIHDRTSSFQAVAKHFLAIGRRHPALIMTPTANREKFDAYVSTLEEHGLREDDYTLVRIDETPTLRFDPQIVYKALDHQFPEGRPPFDGLMCNSDEAAIAATAWLRSRGLRVPEDVAVCGFNNKSFTPYVDPPLASVERHDIEVIEATLRLLSARLEDPKSPHQVERISMDFIPRRSSDSTGASRGEDGKPT
jgi:LacI family transcriptional regulator